MKAAHTYLVLFPVGCRTNDNRQLRHSSLTYEAGEGRNSKPRSSRRVATQITKFKTNDVQLTESVSKPSEVPTVAVLWASMCT